MNTLVINCSPVRNGATAEIVHIVSECLKHKFNVKSICIDDFEFGFCKGCRSCHSTGKCIQHDDIDAIMKEYEWADIIVSVAPSYWADIPGQFKAFIDRCTPWCNTHEPHAELPGEKKGYTIALRTGPGMPECERVIGSIEHFYGHLEIVSCGSLGLCSVECKEDAAGRIEEIAGFCDRIVRKALEDVLSEQIADMKVNTVAVDEKAEHPIYFDKTEKDNSKWLELLARALKESETFEIHCWNEEKEWMEVALQYGTLKASDWKYGKIITGNVTPEFMDMLLNMPKPQDIELDNKMTPFFNVLLNNGFQSSHYGTEIYRNEKDFFLEDEVQ